MIRALVCLMDFGRLGNFVKIEIKTRGINYGS
jgi:hypothetical protein